MPNYTKNYNLEKPLPNENYNVEVFNNNADIIDAELKKLNDRNDRKVDKEEGKGLSTNDYTDEDKTKLTGIEPGANKYIHPPTHPATMIVEDSTHRFVTDKEKNAWNAKETPAGAQAKANAAEQNAKKYAESIKPTKLSQLINDVGYITTQRAVSDSVTSTSSTTAASSKAVKIAYDKAVVALNTANSKLGKTEKAADSDKLDGWHRDQIRDWNNILNKPSAFNPIGHKHSGSDITSTVSNADKVDGKHASELGFKFNAGRTAFNETISGNNRVVKQIYIGSGYKAGRIILLSGSNSKGACGFSAASITFTTNKLDAIAYGTMGISKCWGIMTKKYETDFLLGKEENYNIELDMSYWALYDNSLGVRNVWIEGNYINIEILNDMSSGGTLNVGIKWEVWG
ncbi:Phage tail fibre repeat-containing protein [Caloranaerobacter azorensis DSM 13643]|uniref:Phage tail fibre repeat-containing protein n=1 Tax=Caloranaerobacter azorensis DSM 13643 TaxID=1121264 RepID=A0A1M5VLN2_9FIRM|nr:tail fiber protein [Caloranaerobacter azorensis]SHH76176.1 Phage tail fibre repeat-containing protein [Caloranaerobacter azorensis DSM 13643]